MIKKMKILFIVLILLGGLLFIISGCGNKPEQVLHGDFGEDADTFLTITDDTGRTVVLDNKPERVISLSTSYLTGLNAVEMPLIARVRTRVQVPERYADIEDVGQVANVSLEKIVMLEPDLVIGNSEMHDDLVDILESSNIPIILLAMKTFDETIEKTKLFGDISGNSQKAATIVADMQQRVDDIVAKVPEQGKRVVLMHATAENVSVSLETSIPGDVARILNLDNIVEKKVEMSHDRAPFSLEVIAAENPEVIFLSSMGNSEAIEERMIEDVKSNPAWNNLDAVKNNQVFALPSNLFLTNPGINYPDAIEYMAKDVYPDLLKKSP